MQSPFPGMDPFLEGYMWADVHQALAYQFRRQLAPLVAPTYAVRLAVTMLTDQVPAHELGILYPDVEIIHPTQTPQVTPSYSGELVVIAPAPLSIPLALPVPTRLVTVEIRDVKRNVLVTAIEIVSPVNKREPGLTYFINKRNELRLAGVHILEIDLIRRGTRLWPDADLPDTPYLAVLIRARSPQAEVWPLALREPLPILPVPLLSPTADVPLDLQDALNTIYREANYALTIDYHTAPPLPALRAEDTAWLQEQVQQWRV